MLGKACALAMLAQHAPQPVALIARRLVLVVAIAVAAFLVGSAIFAATRLVSGGSNW